MIGWVYLGANQDYASDDFESYPLGAVSAFYSRSGRLVQWVAVQRTGDPIFNYAVDSFEQYPDGALTATNGGGTFGDTFFTPGRFV